jgi:hypothetical protein
VSASLLPAATSSSQGAVKMPSGASGNTLGTAATYAASSFLQPTNTLGCVDGYDHLPCTVYHMGLTTGLTACTGYANAYETTAAGLYRITGNLYATATSTTSLSVTLLVKEGQISSVTSHGLSVASATIGTSDAWNNATLLEQNIPASTYITWETSCTGTNTNGAWSLDLLVERVA